MISVEWQWCVCLCMLCLSLSALVLAACPPRKYGEDCLSNCLCSREGTAVCSSDTGACICKVGYTGRLCEHDIDECNSLDPPCYRPLMLCSNTRGSYRCICREGYMMSRLGHCTPCHLSAEGANCPNVCLCVTENTLYCEGGKCVCKPGFGGKTCQETSNECDGVLCPSSTVCVDSHLSYTCICGPGLILIESTCKEFETVAAAIETSPGIGELVDVFIFYKLPHEYLYETDTLPNFIYTLTVEATGQRLCEINFWETKADLGSHVHNVDIMENINQRGYNFYSHVVIIFTEAIYSVVHLTPKTSDYYEMVLEFDVRHKSHAEIDCLLGMRISGTSKSIRNAVTHKRQSYLSFDIEFNETKDCGETPRVGWTFYSISPFVGLNKDVCLDSRHFRHLDINALIEQQREFIISDHRSLKEILPRATLPLGHVMICVEAHVHRDRRLRVTTCGYIDVKPSYVIQGKIVPNNEDIGWTSDYNFTLTADFVEPDSYSELEYHWSCTVIKRENTDDRHECKGYNAALRQLDLTQPVLAVTGGFIERFYKIHFLVTVRIKSRPEVTDTDQVTVWAERFWSDHYFPMIIDCEHTCEDVIGTGKNVILKTRFPFTLPRLRSINYHWYVVVNAIRVSDEVAKGIIPTLHVTAWNWEGVRFFVNSSGLEAGKSYALNLNAKIDIHQIDYEYDTVTWYFFLVEPPPSGDGCTISPTTGEAVFTRFTVKCKNYIDPVSHLPLTYKLYQHDHTGHSEISTLIAYSASPVMDTITLSTAGGAGVATVLLFVAVTNVKGTAINVPLSVQLTTLDQAESLKRLIGNVKIESGGQEDARAMKDIATVISTDSTADLSDKVTVRQDVLNNVEKLDSDSRENIQQVSHVLSVSVEKADEIEPSGLDSGIKTAAKLAKYLGKVSDDSFDVTKTVALSQVNALSKLIYVASATGQYLSSQNDSNTTEGMDMLNENVQQSLLATSSITNIANVLLVSLEESGEAFEIQTDFMDVHVSSKNVDPNSAFEAGSKEAKFRLPSLDSGVPENESVSTEFEIFRSNPYGWTANRVRGGMPVVKATLARQKERNLLKKPGAQEKFRFSKPADVFLKYNASVDNNYYPILIKTDITNSTGFSHIRRSSCVHIVAKVSTEHTTVMQIASQNNLQLLVKAEYTNSFYHFDEVHDDDMLEMPIYGLPSLNMSTYHLYRDPYLLFLPQLTEHQIKRNHPYYRIMIRVKLNQIVDTGSLLRVEIDSNNTEYEDGIPGEYYNVSIMATPHEMACLHFDEAKADYLSDECRVSMYSDLDLMHCRCVVAAAYTGSAIVLPRLINPLDIDLFLEVFANPLVVSMVIAVWLIYIALIAWGRHQDKLDETKTAVTVLDDNKDENSYVYLICVVTGWSASSATSSNVFIRLKGSWYQSENHVLQDSTRHLFQSGAENWFMLTTEDDIGDLHSVIVWTDFSGAYPSWFLSAVYVQNMQTNETWMCPFNDWISVGLGSEQLQAEIPAMEEKTYSSKWKLQLVKKGQNDIRNDHLWFGILMKTPYNKFTRVRRLTTALSVLQSLMLLNHMFFGIRDKDDPGQFIEVFDQQIHVTSIIIGLQTVFIIFVIQLIISNLFTRIGPHPKSITAEEETQDNTVHDFLARRKTMAAVLAHSESLSDGNEGSNGSSDDESGSSDDSSGSDDMDSNASNKSFRGSSSAKKRKSSVDPPLQIQESNSTDPKVPASDKSEIIGEQSQTPANTRFMLPWWFIYVSWTFLIFYNLFLAYYIMLYGLSLGYERSVDYVLAFFAGFFMNVFLLQPVMLILMVLIFVLIFQQGHSLKEQAPVAKLNDGIKLVQQRKKYNKKFRTMIPKVTCRVPLNTTEAKHVLERLAMETAAREMIRDMFFYTIFMVSVLVVAYGHMDVRSQFLQTQYVKHRFLRTPIFVEDIDEGYQSLGELENVHSADDMWQYIRTVVAPGMIKDEGTISTDDDVYLIGAARLRQVRSQGNSDACKKLPTSLSSLFFEETCSYSSYYVSEETKTYKSTWKVVSNVSRDIIDDSPYVHRSSKELNGAILIGQHGVYSGGGYVVPLGQDAMGSVNDIITKLYKSDWIDPLTKCIFVEFTLYNAASDHFTNVIILFEFANFGVIYPSALINSANFLNHELNTQKWLQLSHGILVIFALFYTFVEIQTFRKTTFKKYFGSFWHCLEAFTIALTGAVGIIFFLRYYEFVKVLRDLQKYGNIHFLNFAAVFQMDGVLHKSLALLGGLVIFKMLKVTAFNPLVVITFRSFRNAQADLYGFLVMTTILFLAFAATGLLLFGRIVRSYRSITVSLFTLLFFIMGESEYNSLIEGNLVLGRLFFLTVMVASQYVIVNVFCSILYEGFELTRYMAFRRERETIKYMVSRLKFYSGFGPKNVRTKKS